MKAATAVDTSSFKIKPVDCIASSNWKDLFQVKRYLHSDPRNPSLVPNSTYSGGFELFKCVSTQIYDKQGMVIGTQPQDLLIYGFNNNKTHSMRFEYADRIGGYSVYIGPNLRSLR